MVIMYNECFRTFELNWNKRWVGGLGVWMKTQQLELHKCFISYEWTKIEFHTVPWIYINKNFIYLYFVMLQPQNCNVIFIVLLSKFWKNLSYLCNNLNIARVYYRCQLYAQIALLLFSHIRSVIMVNTV